MRSLSRILRLVTVAAVSGICLGEAPPAQGTTCVLRYVEKFPITRVFPYFPGTTITERRAADLLFEPLVRRTPGGTCASVVLDLEAAKPNADRTVWTFPLKPTTWHSRRPLTATDIVRTFEELRRLEQAGLPAWASELVYFRRIARMETSGQDLVVHFKDPTPADVACVCLEFFYVIPWEDLPRLTDNFAGYLNDYIFDANELTQGLVGNGRWMKSPGIGMISDAYDITLAAFPEFPGGESRIQEVHGRFQPIAAERVNYFKQGEVNVIIDVPPDLRNDLLNVSGAQVFPHERNSFTVVTISQRNSALADRRVREALIYAINRVEILNAQYGGSGDVIEAPYPPETICWNPDVVPRAYDPKKSVRLLEEAGYQGSPEVGWTKDGYGALKNFEFLYETAITAEEDVFVIRSICDDLRQIGVDVRMIGDEPARVRMRLAKGDYDFHLRTVQVGRAWDVSSFLSDEYTEDPENKHLICSPGVKKLFPLYSEALSSGDLPRMADIGHDLHQEIARACDHIYLWSPRTYGVFRSDEVIFQIYGTTLFELPGLWDCRQE